MHNKCEISENYLFFNCFKLIIETVNSFKGGIFLTGLLLRIGYRLEKTPCIEEYKLNSKKVELNLHELCSDICKCEDFTRTST